jgi:hypothetical protein
MSDLFSAAAARAQQKRRSEDRPLYKGAPVTMENNALADLINEANRAEAERKAQAEAFQAQIRAAFDGVIELANSLGRKVKEITWNGEVAFVVRDGEAVRMQIGEIRDIRALQIAVARLINGAMGC